MSVEPNGDVMRELERLDRWLEGEEEGDIPLEVLRGRGMVIPDDDASLDDAALHAKLWEVLRGMADLNLVLDSTNHLSDRELYRWLVGDCLRQQTLLSGEEGDFWHLSPVAGGSADDNEIFLRYYADDETREVWRREVPERELPPKEKPPYDRDRFLPGGEDELELLIR